MLKCDNAGIIELDYEDASFWIGKKIDSIDFLPEGYLIPINGSGKYFMPKFIEWQYKDLTSDKHIVVQARQTLDKYGLIDDEFNLVLDKCYIKVTQTLSNSQATDIGKGIGIEGGVGENPKPTPEETSLVFYEEQVKKARGFSGPAAENYIRLVGHICQKNEDGTLRMSDLMKVKNQLSLNDFAKLYKLTNGNYDTIMEKVDSFQTNKDYHKKYKDIYLSVNKWIIKDRKK